MAPIEKLHAKPKPAEVLPKPEASPAQKAQEHKRLGHEEASGNSMDKHAKWTQFADNKENSGGQPPSVHRHNLEQKKVEEGSDAARVEIQRMRDHMTGKV